MANLVAQWVALFKRRAWRTKDAATQLRRTHGENDLRKCLGPFDLIMLGIGATGYRGVHKCATAVPSRLGAVPHSSMQDRCCC